MERYLAPPIGETTAIQVLHALAAREEHGTLLIGSPDDGGGSVFIRQITQPDAAGACYFLVVENNDSPANTNYTQQVQCKTVEGMREWAQEHCPFYIAKTNTLDLDLDDAGLVRGDA